MGVRVCYLIWAKQKLLRHDTGCTDIAWASWIIRGIAAMQPRPLLAFACQKKRLPLLPDIRTADVRLYDAPYSRELEALPRDLQETLGRLCIVGKVFLPCTGWSNVRP